MAEVDRERRLRELFDRALSLPPSQREQVIAEAADELLAERLRALLVQDAHGTAGVLQRAPADGMQALRRVGRYELLRELGRGGMGTVVLARQIEPVERLVALKMVHAGGDSAEVEQRFAVERQALALMNHPGIARIFDGGTTDDGIPYFVMEYVRGEPITSYCDRRRLDCRARIELFVKVCEAVQHAHQKAVLHRDLKPGNVLVTEADGSPEPKIIDFGVARALGGGLGQQLTEGGVVGTFVYMSPEQADPAGQDVDTRADIYSLGVMLYQLLTGELPLLFDLDTDGFVGFQRALLQTQPPRASKRVRALPLPQQAERAESRSTTPVALCRQLQDDLDWILMCTLAKDRNRRYASAAEFAQELQRHQAHQPVAACPPTLRYRASKFVRRHRVPVVAAVLVVLGLSGGILGATRGKQVAEAARDAETAVRLQQERQLRRQRAVGDYLEFLLFHGDPGTGSSPPPLRQVLDELAPTIALHFAGRPIEAAAVHAGVGRAYLATGEPAKAEEQLRAAWALMNGESDLDAGEACMLLYDLSRARRLAYGASASRDVLVHLLELGARAVAVAQPALALQLREIAPELLPPTPSPQLLARCDALLTRLGELAADSEAKRIAVRMLAAVLVHMQQEAWPGGETLLHRLEAVVRPSPGADVDFLLVLGRFADSQLAVGRFDAARRLAAEVGDSMLRLGLGDHWLALHAERIRGLALALGGEPAAGETALVALQLRLWALPAVANERARAAANCLTELCTRLAAQGQLQAFLDQSLRRWQQHAASDPQAAPWWPADADGLPAAATVAARTLVEQALVAGSSPRLQAVLGSLLLREDRAEAAAAALDSAIANSPQPTPELQADAAIARARVGNAAAATAIVADLRARSGGSGALARRCQRALHRVGAAGLR